MRSALQPESSASAALSAAIIKHREIRVPGTDNMAFDIVIMAAGKGTRMKSTLPKVLHKLAGRSLLQHVLETAATLGADRIVAITGHGAAEVEKSAIAPNLRFVRQAPQLGTGHAVQQAAPLLHDDGP